ncbi:MAG TPA: TIGR03016 family PEP-CTERM system-associated outer membrane protein, partial [Candidatus Tenderia electrophaga]|nr:TIGR03016 family PEP-CTERM system-associated outer membrane protein [Candidatus Tenderia electrophaga]
MVTTVAMAHPVINPGRSIKFCCRDRYAPSLPLKAGLLFVLGCLPAVAQSADWDSTAKLALSEVYSDNIRLSVADEESDSITTITPGFSLKGQGARLKLGIDYSMQNLFYAQNSDQNRIYHQLQASEQSELIKDLFYFDATASVSQRLSNPAASFARDNLNLTNNRGDVVTWQVEPYLKPNLGAYVSAELRYSLR